jgi:hypothetical protein
VLLGCGSREMTWQDCIGRYRGAVGGRRSARYWSRTWLVGSGDRVALAPLYSMVATIVATLIATVTVIGQSVRASRATPAWALRPV